MSSIACIQVEDAVLLSWLIQSAALTVVDAVAVVAAAGHASALLGVLFHVEPLLLQEFRGVPWLLLRLLKAAVMCLWSLRLLCGQFLRRQLAPKAA